MDFSFYRKSYDEHVRGLQTNTGEAMEKAVGSIDHAHFLSFGALMRHIVQQAGLQTGDYLVDAGCGSGRLAAALSVWLEGRYLGIDIVTELLDHARSLCNRPDWRFEPVGDVRIPEEDGKTDMVCFFSLFTHLMHEDSYRYLMEANRVLKPGGRTVFSFLEFFIPAHWEVFNDMLKARAQNVSTHHNQFLSRDIIRDWLPSLGFSLVAFHDGDKPWPGLDTEAILGQSVCIIQKQ
jgi:ubiquinone/menaquinone biosynthesis C-methylase UbiE